VHADALICDHLVTCQDLDGLRFADSWPAGGDFHPSGSPPDTRRGRGRSRRKRTAALGAVIVATLVAIVAVLSGGAGAAGTSTYLVVYKGTSVPSDASSSIQQAGGSIVASYDQIGVVVAKSSSPSFASNA